MPRSCRRYLPSLEEERYMPRPKGFYFRWNFRHRNHPIFRVRMAMLRHYTRNRASA
jgi:hypothetical protein